ncbi:MAG: tetracycline resistance MFS efflux pump [Candidatus Angelobacter sp. Gp1-AA117]|nr:MAG: tetracycline resistance MFS efflux pump [Candidatus Angelobacter sp. Gp1-AA117]
MTEPASGHGRAAFIFIFITVLLDMLALGIIIPVLPKLIVQFEHGDISIAATQNGIFAFVFAAMQFVFAPVAGMLSDRFGRRPVILMSNFGLGCDYLLMALAPSLSWLLLGRFISGITSSSIPTANAYIADITPQEQRAARFGMLGAAFGLGFIIGPALGGFLGGYGLRYPFWAAACLSLANFAYGAFILPESLSKDRRAVFSFGKANPVGSLKLLRSHPALFGLASAMFLYYLAHESLPSMFVLYVDYRYHWGARLTGYALAGVGVCMSIVSAVLIRMFTRRFGEVRTLFAGLCFGVLGFGLFAGATTTTLFLIGCPLISLWGLAGPSMQALMSKRAAASEQGQLQGALASLFGIAGMIGPIMFSEIFAFTISQKHGVDFPGATYWLASVLLLGSLMIASAVTRPAAQPLVASSGSAGG